MTGAFGEEAMGDWMSLEALRELMEATHLNGSPQRCYDFHARHRD